jgi:hypothetical protein
VTVWRGQERFMRAEVAVLCATRTPVGIPPLPAIVRERIMAFTLADPPGEVGLCRRTLLCSAFT